MANSKWRESAEAIRGEIERGALKSGDHLPSETEVADHWRVSRMTAHRAMAYLQNLGLVNRQRRKGTTVAGEGERRAGIVALLFHHRNDSLELQYLLGVRSGIPDDDHLLLWNTENNPKREAYYLERASEEANGIICFPTCAPENTPIIHRIVEKGTPIVCLDRVPKDAPVDAVLTDNYRATLNALRFMREHGHQRIAYITENRMEVSAVWERYEAYLTAMAEAGIEDVYPYVRKLLCDLGFHTDLLTQTIGDALQCMLNLPQPPTAVFCMHDYYLAAVLECCDILGIKVPEDLEIISFNDCPPLVPRFSRSVNRIVQQAQVIGKLAAQRLQLRLEGEVMQPETIKVMAHFYPARHIRAVNLDEGPDQGKPRFIQSETIVTG